MENSSLKKNFEPLSCSEEMKDEKKRQASQEPASSKRKYVQVNYDKRKELIQVMDKEHLTIKSAAEKLHINYPTAKNIVKLYRREQRIEKLPKRSNLTLNKITSPPIRADAALYQAALSPFYNEDEAAKIMCNHKANVNLSSPMDCDQGLEMVIKSLNPEGLSKICQNIHKLNAKPGNTATTAAQISKHHFWI